MKCLPAALLTLCALSHSGPALAQTKDALDAAVAETVTEFTKLDPHRAELASQAAGMLIFPQVTKGGIALASAYGEGALNVAGVTVGYYSEASASLGLTAGMATHREIILFMTREALDRFLRSKNWSVGADSGIAVVSKGMVDDYHSYALKKPILVFIFGQRGLMADLSLQGTKINKIVK
jgi:lipid-binding SYLF domain-containing protein